jgi:hypothetical protein
MKSPLATIQKSFENKAKLVEALEKITQDEGLWVSRLNANKGLAHVSNAKLLKLHATFAAVKEKFGTRSALIDAIVDFEKRAKDEGYKSRLGAYPVPRLWDMYKAASKRAAVKAKVPAAAKPAAAKKPVAAKKPAAAAPVAAKKPAAKKPAAKKK